jgi:ADP-ribosylglycohydrolase
MFDQFEEAYYMLGAIIGTSQAVSTSGNIKTKDFPLFRDDCFFTDDTVMTVAVADALMNGGAEHFIDSMKKFGRMYPNAGYGGYFHSWLLSEDRKPYNSWGNGSAMRVSPCAWLRPADRLKWAKLPAEVTHNHPEGIKGAMAVTDAIFMCRMGRHKTQIKEHTEQAYGYDLSRTLDEIRPTYRFDVSCQGTVPEAVIAFLESAGFEDAIRNAISIGGDSDTLTAITGSIADAAYGIPKAIADKALGYLDAPLREVYERWCAYCGNYAPLADDVAE